MNTRLLKAKCVEKGINFEKLAEATGVCIGTFYSRVRKETFTVSDVRKIAKELNLSPDDVLAIFFEKEVA